MDAGIVDLAFGPPVHSIGVPGVFVKGGNVYRVSLEQGQHLEKDLVVHRAGAQHAGTPVGFDFAFDVGAVEAHDGAIDARLGQERPHGAGHSRRDHDKGNAFFVQAAQGLYRAVRQVPFSVQEGAVDVGTGQTVRERRR